MSLNSRYQIPQTGLLTQPSGRSKRKAMPSHQASGKEIIEIEVVFDAKEGNTTEQKQKKADKD